MQYPLVAIMSYRMVQTGPKIQTGGAIFGAIQVFAFKSPTIQYAPAATTSVQA
jgi:hypothetical protein